MDLLEAISAEDKWSQKCVRQHSRVPDISTGSSPGFFLASWMSWEQVLTQEGDIKRQHGSNKERD